MHSFYSGKDGATIQGYLNKLHFVSFQLISSQEEKFESGQNVVSFLTEKGFTDVWHFAPASGVYFDDEDRAYVNLIGIFVSGISLRLVPYHTRTGDGYSYNFSQSNMSEYVTEL